MSYVNYNIIISIQVPFIIDEANLDTNNETIKLHVCNSSQLANSGHGARVKVMHNGKELFSVSPIHPDTAFIGNNKIKVNKLKAKDRAIFTAVSNFATNNKDLIVEYQNFRNPPSLSRVKEIEGILRRNAKNIFK